MPESASQHFGLAQSELTTEALQQLAILRLQAERHQSARHSAPPSDVGQPAQQVGAGDASEVGRTLILAERAHRLWSNMTSPWCGVQTHQQPASGRIAAAARP
jgi:hypothetical protein